MAGYIGSKASVVSSGAERKKVFTATAGQTAFTGLTYSPNRVHVFQNGVRLVDGTDYTATDGNSLTLTVGALADDQVVVVSYSTFQTSDTVSSSAGGTFAGNVNFTGAFTSRGIDDNSDATAITIDSSENVGIGTSSPSEKLTIQSGNLNFMGGTNDAQYIKFGDTSDDDIGNIFYYHGNNNMVFTTNASEAMRIDSSGDLLVGKTSTSINTAGSRLIGGGAGAQFTADGTEALALNRLTNDGDLIWLGKAGSKVGSIGSVSGAVSYIVLDPRANGSGIRGTTNGLLPANQAGAATNNHVDLGSGTNAFRNLYLSGGIQFDSRSNKLDDYEEGTWTPVAADNSSGGNTSTTGQGFYTKIGRLVVATCDIININTTGLSSGNSFFVQGLPFANNGTVRSTATLQVNLVNKGDGLFAHLSENGTFFTFKYNDDSKNNAASGLLVSDVNDDQADMFGITLVYHTAT